ncbi:hypothetical protein [Diaphorobacter sp. HDW4B]|uniref:hypothetical protein n=1 Tax=Diaphorobacter sp. HDW4B TaxID=2714925 RepID=UPI001F0DA4A6|nr:hypothetical protein [Diaphorobacter sp. HDW4B]
MESPNSPHDAVRAPNIVHTEIHDTDILELVDSSSDDLVRSIGEQQSKISAWPFLLFGLLFLMVVLGHNFPNMPSVVKWLGGLVIAAVTYWCFQRDKLKKLTVLFYEPDAPASALFEDLMTAFKKASSQQKLKAITVTSRYADTKYSAGAQQGLKFGSASAHLGDAPNVVANISIPIFTAEKTTLAFYPDRILIFKDGKVGSINYSSIDVECNAVTYVEEESVPNDARVVGHTWKYVNKKGGPDRRFKDNKQIPLCAYTQMKLRTSTGLDVQFLGSKENAFNDLASALLRTSRVMR